MRALITGAAGFVGRHMRAELEGRGWEVYGFDVRYPDHWEARGTAGRNRFGQYHYHDVRRMADFPDYGRWDLVVHCAYAVGGRAAIDGVPMNLAHNVAADAALFEWALATGQPRVLYFSSSAAYPVSMQGVAGVGPVEDAVARGMRLHEVDIDPTDAEEPDAAYGWAKLTGERLAAAAAAEGLAVHVVRPFSGYGGDQGPEYPFPALLHRVLTNSGEPVEVWGSAGQVRDWIHIDDVVRGALAVVDADDRRAINLCTGVPTSMAALIGLMWSIVHPDREVPEVKVLAEKPMGVFWRVGNPDRMREHYTPVVSLQEGIERAAALLRAQGGERRAA